MRAEHSNRAPLFGVSGIIKNRVFCKISSVIASHRSPYKNRYLLDKSHLTAQNKILTDTFLVHIDATSRVPRNFGTYRPVSSRVPRNPGTRDGMYQKSWYMELYPALPKLL